MDLNHLLARHQISLMRVRAAASPEARYAHAGLTRGYATRIAALQAHSGATSPLAGRAA